MTTNDHAQEVLQAVVISFRQRSWRPRPYISRRVSSCMALPTLALMISLIAFAGAARAQEELRRNISTLCMRAFSDVHIESYTLVHKSWDETDIERVLDAEIDRAVADTKQRTSYGERFLSGWNQETARQLADSVAQLAFTSPAVNREMKHLAERITANLTRQLEPRSRWAIERGLTSIQTYLGSNYSRHLVPVMERHVKDMHLQLGPKFSMGNVGDAAARHAVALSGITVIIASHIAKKVLQQLTEKIFHRIIGRFASRILGRVGTVAIPVVGWLIGAGMIVFDLVQGADGALPDIQKALKSHETKVELCNQVTIAFEQELPTIMAETQEDLATEVYNIWLSFLGKYPAVLKLTRESELFRTEIVETTPADSANFNKLAHLVEVSLNAAGKEEVVGLVARGILQKLKLLPEESHVIILDTGSPLVLYQWSELAHERLMEVVRLGLHRHIKPIDLDRDQLSALLEIKDPISVGLLLKLDLGEVKTALRIFPAAQLDRLLKLLSTDAMKTMARYGHNASRGVTEEFVRLLIADPRLIRFIGTDGMNQIFLAGGTIDDLKSFLYWQSAIRWIGLLISTVAVVIISLYFILTRWRKRPLTGSMR